MADKKTRKTRSDCTVGTFEKKHGLPNVEVCINNSKLVTKEEFDKIEFKEKDQAVVMVSMK